MRSGPVPWRDGWKREWRSAQGLAEFLGGAIVPSPERPMERAGLRVSQKEGDLVDGELPVPEQSGRHLSTESFQDGGEGGALFLQASLQGSRAHAEYLCGLLQGGPEPAAGPVIATAGGCDGIITSVFVTR